jgi:hypothetical protein
MPMKTPLKQNSVTMMPATIGVMIVDPRKFPQPKPTPITRGEFAKKPAKRLTYAQLLKQAAKQKPPQSWFEENHASLRTA